MTFYEAQGNYILKKNIKEKAQWKIQIKEQTVNTSEEYELVIATDERNSEDEEAINTEL